MKKEIAKGFCSAFDGYENTNDEVNIEGYGRIKYQGTFANWEGIFYPTNANEITLKVTIQAEEDIEYLLENRKYMFCGRHKRYNFNDTDIDLKDIEDITELEKAIRKRYIGAVILPLFMYDHSGIALSTTPFGCKLDSGQLGFVLMTKETAEDWGLATEEEMKEAIISGIKYYNKVNQETHYRVNIYEGYDCKSCKNIEFREVACSSLFEEDLEEQLTLN